MVPSLSVRLQLRCRQVVCGIPMAQIAAGANAGDDFVIPFCIREIATVLVLLRTFEIHPGNIDENLHPRRLANVAQEAARGGTLYRAIEDCDDRPTQAYIVTQFEQLVRALVGFAYLHGAIVLRHGMYSWDAKLPVWTHRQAAVEQWLRNQRLPNRGSPPDWALPVADGLYEAQPRWLESVCRGGAR